MQMGTFRTETSSTSAASLFGKQRLDLIINHCRKEGLHAHAHADTHTLKLALNMPISINPLPLKEPSELISILVWFPFWMQRVIAVFFRILFWLFCWSETFLRGYGGVRNALLWSLVHLATFFVLAIDESIARQRALLRVPSDTVFLSKRTDRATL